MKKLFILFSFLVPMGAFTQTLSPEEALEKFSKYPQERIFVQFDKDEYLAGETIFFKAWVFSKPGLSRISTNLYIEFLDKNKNSIYRNVLPLATGIADGSYSIPKKLNEDIYYFRAYTSWMLNFDEKIQFVQPIAVYNPASSTKLVEQTSMGKASVHPESGILLDNVQSKVAVRLHSSGDLPKNWSGYLFEGSDSSNKIAEFSSLNEEVAQFSFVPVYGKQYSVKLIDEDKHSQIISLPQVKKEGIALQTADRPNGIAYRLTGKGLKNGLQGYKILASLYDEVLYSAIIKTSKGQLDGTIPVDLNSKGLVQITIFNANGNAIAERLCFPNLPSVYNTPKISQNKISSEPKGLNEWLVDIDTLNTGSYVIEVADENSFLKNSCSWLGSFWLNGLSSMPYNTDGYFDQDNKTASEALDALLITEKNNLFDWEKISKKPVPGLSYLPDNFLSYYGEVTNNNKLVTNKNVTVLFQLKDSSRIILKAHTDSAGMFKVKNLIFHDTAKVYYHLPDDKVISKELDVDFKRIDYFVRYSSPLPPSSYIVTERNPNDSIPEKVKAYAGTLRNSETDDRYKMMENITIKAKARTPKDVLNRQLSSPMFSEPGEVVFDFMNETQDLGGSSVLEWLGGRVPGLTYENPDIVMRGQLVKIYIDEFAADAAQLLSIPPTDIAMVKILRHPFLLGSSTPVLAVYLKRGELFANSKLPTPEFNKQTLLGYPSAEKFEMPDYSDANSNKNLHDTRSVLYWNTSISAEEGKAVVRFYNNDAPKKLRLIVIGVNNNGTPVYMNKEILL